MKLFLIVAATVVVVVVVVDRKQKKEMKGARKSIKNVIMTVIAKNKLYFRCHFVWNKMK